MLPGNRPSAMASAAHKAAERVTYLMAGGLQAQAAALARPVDDVGGR